VHKGCALDQHSKADFPSTEQKLREILLLIDLDVCGHMSSSSLISSPCYVSFTDDFSCKTWIYFMKTKDEMFFKFKEFEALVENQTGKRSKCLGLITGESTPLRTLMPFAGKQELRGH
jgi:hypothetical protein